MTAQIVLKYLACVLASKITMENEPLCIPDIQAGILYRLYSLSKYAVPSMTTGLPAV